MREIISSLDIGSDSIKFIVGEFFEDRLHILSASKITNSGIENGKIVDADEVVNAINKAVSDASEKLGVKIDKCLLSINMINTKLAKSAYAIKIKSEDGKISSQDIDEIIMKCADGKVPEDYVLVGVLPVEYTVDGDEVITYPLGYKTENLGLKAVVISSPKEYVAALLEVTNKAGLKVIDVVPSALGDYSVFKTHETDDSVGAIINLGSEFSSISIFNKGVMTNTKTIPFGGKNIVKDISFVAKLSDKEAYAVYKDIVLSNGRLANPNEYRVVTDLDGERIKLNQYDMSEIASGRIDEILNLVKKQINILTKKEISYIIVTGGLTELRDFSLSLERVFGKDFTLGNMNTLGARDNAYSSAVGIIQYFENKLALTGKKYSVLSKDELDDMDRGEDEDNNSLISKVFGYFFDN